MINRDDKISKLSRWAETKKRIALDCLGDNRYKSLRIRKGEVLYCDLGENIGHETNKCRPVLVISSTKNNSKFPYVLVAPISSKVHYKYRNGRCSGLKYPTEVLLNKNEYSYLSKDSVVKLSQLRTVEKKRFIGSVIGSVNEATIEFINEKIMHILDLSVDK
ncbi:type II toxin-antitoxin system PemK/MazF family toxin [Abiotrophia defectiva]|uniref:type II toxin-antitoxin system PemK/MazF family toxin n=1 Tax=Abiotrophia defectiva TaxID=46125 RepID=UPI0028D5C538|nr:type II toxin-antitoxin system PemK/MazF family toxin [Abiotrophia defectiva]